MNLLWNAIIGSVAKGLYELLAYINRMVMENVQTKIIIIGNTKMVNKIQSNVSLENRLTWTNLLLSSMTLSMNFVGWPFCSVYPLLSRN